MERETLIMKPFGYNPTVKNFRTYLPSSYKLSIYSIKNIHNPNITDTIYKFYRRKSELLIYKGVSNREMFFSGAIYDSKIQLQNGINVGIKRNDFFNHFTNLKPSVADTIKVSSNQKGINSINFIFKEDKLYFIKLDNYID